VNTETATHESRSDPAPHGTVRVKTAVQMTNGRHQVAHIYLDANTMFQTPEVMRRQRVHPEVRAAAAEIITETGFMKVGSCGVGVEMARESSGS
jgi:hypothetical protein